MSLKMLKTSSVMLLAAFLCLISKTVDAKSKHVSVSLDAKWLNTPMAAEASEYLAKENVHLFWEFVEELTALEEQHVQGESQEDDYQIISRIVDKFLPDKQTRLFHFAMSVRAHSPTVEMHGQLARDLPLPECASFYDVHGVRSCDVKDLDKLLSQAADKSPGLLLERDHVYPRQGAKTVPDPGSTPATPATPAAPAAKPTVILYGQVGTDAFRVLHQMLKFYAERGKIRYIIRHYFKPVSNEKVRLSGYGVELAIKSQEYKAQDDTKIQDDKEAEKDDGPDELQGFVFSTLKKLHPDKVEDLKKFKDHLVTSTHEVPTLKVWQLQDLSFQAASKIVSMSRGEQLGALRDISQNFPILSGQLVKTTVPDAVRKEIRRNQMLFERRYGLNPGDCALFLNGVQLDLDMHDAFTLVDTLTAEVKLLAGLAELGLKGRQLTEVLQIDVRDSDNSYALDIRDKSIVYVNDLEKDRRYSNWPRNLEELLKPTFPGMLRHMARNMFHLVFVVDPSEKSSVELVRMAEAFYVHNAPIRIGLLLVVNEAEVVDGEDDLGVAMYRGFQFTASKDGYGKALSFLTDVYDRVAVHGWSVDTVKQVLAETVSSSKIPDIISTSKYDSGRMTPKVFLPSQDSVDYFMRTGLGSLPQVLMNGQPLRAEELSQDSFEEAVVGAILKTTPELQKAVYHGELTNSMSVIDWLMRRPNVMPRLNQRVFSNKNTYLSYAAKPGSVSMNDSDAFSKLTSPQMTVNLARQQKYFTKNEESVVRSVTMLVVTNLETKEGRQLLLDAIKHLKSSNNVRLGVVYNAGGDVTDHVTGFWFRLVHTALNSLPNALAKQFLTRILKSDEADSIATGKVKLDEFQVHGMDVGAFESDMRSMSADVMKSHRALSRQALGLGAGQRAVVVNGRVIGPFAADETFSPEDFSVLEKHCETTVAEKVEDTVSNMDFEDDEASDLIMKISAQILGNPLASATRKQMIDLDDTHSAIRLLPDKKDSPFEVLAIVDPLTRDAQRIAPLVILLRELLDAKVTVLMNCKDKLSEMPLKNFYRYVLEPRPRFESGLLVAPAARFTELPHALILTMNVDPPQGWLVEATRTPYDLDNIKLQEIGGSVTAYYELENLLLEGHCFDTTSGGSPPRGLQFTLGTSSKPVMVDTIVMANLGYFQLKANPGAWLLRLREGKSKEIYDIASHDFTDSTSESDDVIVVMDSFKSKIIKVKVAKKADKLKEDVLDSGKDDKAGGGLWESLSRESWGPLEGVYKWLKPFLPTSVFSSFSGKKKTGSDDSKSEETLNIFSVASGHLYERLLRIMTLGVMKHTKSKVKFWILKNYLSPSFKETIPILAKEYGFEYELVQYKWPRWLHQQTEKQRIIWGYKILFLDVLFPLDVKKIIFVDADQIVRADLQELYDLDLEGAPYGYTPFCDSRTEMEGFRFWKHGYWASHLGHRKYHISALYVVDLVKFRRIAAGDRLRGQYQGLSQDPNSLSNLDQDLPNNMIHQVAIKSLPMEWLWCETWCSDSEKKYAKTIDMCNNPQTKEPKLVAARRIAPEWTQYDDEIKQLLDKKHHKLKTHTSKDTKSAPHTPEQDTVRDEL